MNPRSVQDRLGRYGSLILWMGFIYFASTGEFSAANTSRILRPLLLWLFPGMSPGEFEVVHFLTRKAAHFFEYFVLGLLTGRAFITSQQFHRYWLPLGMGLVFLFALSDEFHQSFVSTRTASIFDSLIDFAGGLAGFFIIARWLRVSKRTSAFLPKSAAKIQ